MHYDSYIPSMMDVLERIDAKLEGTRRRDLRSAASSFCKAVGKAPQEIAVVPHEIRKLREAVSPLAIGISERRWANICSGVAKAIELVRDMVPSRNMTPLLPEWQQLLDSLPKSLLRKMSPGARYLSGKGVAPSAVCLDDLTGYCEAVLHNRMRRNAEQAVDEFIWGWNQAVKQHPAWPQVSIPRSDKRDIFSLPFEYFPPSFVEDVEAYLDRLGQGILSSFCDDDDDNDDEIDFGPMRPVQPATIETRRRQLRAAASALVHSGVAASEITSIAKLVEIANAKKILHFMMQRNADGQTSAGVAQLANFLAKLALHWVKVEPSHHQKLKHLAAAIAILIVIPLRRRNLAAIDINQHLIANRNGVYLVIPEAQTKNREAVNFQIPSFALEIVKWYIREYRPYLIAGQSSALFPGRGGACKAPHTLAQQVKGTIKQFVGLDFNIHLFRHAAGKIFLDINPGNYEVVRQLLRHKSINTTTSAYSGAETRKAGLLYAELLAGLRAAHEPARKAKRSFP
jgi:integrase